MLRRGHCQYVGPVIPAVVDVLCCPLDRGQLSVESRRVLCPSGHSFDLARQGYVNLAAPRGKRTKLRSDDAAMVTARERFLATGAFAPILRAVAQHASPTTTVRESSIVVELGAGTAAYLAAALYEAPAAHGLAIDLSVPATVRAARAHPRACAVVADSWQPLPINDGAVDSVIVAFAPRNLPEIVRVLRPGGRLVLAAAQPGHLHELQAEFGLLKVSTKNTDRLEGTASQAGLALVSHELLNYQLELDHQSTLDIINMGPNAWHVDADRLAEVVAAGPAVRGVSTAVGIWVFERSTATPNP